ATPSRPSPKRAPRADSPRTHSPRLSQKCAPFRTAAATAEAATPVVATPVAPFSAASSAPSSEATARHDRRAEPGELPAARGEVHHRLLAPAPVVLEEARGAPRARVPGAVGARVAAGFRHRTHDEQQPHQHHTSKGTS